MGKIEAMAARQTKPTEVKVKVSLVLVKVYRVCPAFLRLIMLGFQTLNKNRSLKLDIIIIILVMKVAVQSS